MGTFKADRIFSEENLMHTFGALVKLARKQRKQTQAQLARQVGLAQSVLSQIENGQVRAASQTKLEALAKLLEIDTEAAAAGAPMGSTANDLAYCSNSECPSADPYLIGSDVIVKPQILKLVVAGQPFCRVCGEPLCTACEECGAPVTVAIHCPACGRSYLPPPARWNELPRADAEAEMERTRARNQSIRDVTLYETPFFVHLTQTATKGTPRNEEGTRHGQE